MYKDGTQELHLNIEDLSTSGIKKLEAMYAHALELDLSVEVAYIYPVPVLIATYELSDIKFIKFMEEKC